MSVYRIARDYLAEAPRAALVDLLGFALLCGLITAGFAVPGLL